MAISVRHNQMVPGLGPLGTTSSQAWMYLQPIFDSPDIMKQLPTEGKKFKVVDGRDGPRGNPRDGELRGGR